MDARNLQRRCYGNCPVEVDRGCCQPPLPYYKITNSKVSISGKVNNGFERCLRGCMPCCVASGGSLTDNIDLSQIKDVNSRKIGSTCCATGQFRLEIVSAVEGSFSLLFSTEAGPVVEQKLLNAMEESSTLNR